MTDSLVPGSAEDDDSGFIAVGTPVDLDNCAREPIHIPGSIQPRGVLIVVRDPELDIVQISANVEALLGVPVSAALGEHLSTVIGAGPAAEIERATASFSDLRERNPHEVTLVVHGNSLIFDAILHREPGGVLLVELELAFGPRPFSFPNTYQAVRKSVGELNRAASLAELYGITARSVRELTGFDRVMVYRYDHEYNGEVVAEDKREDLNSFVGQHYPASDIPAQARALYEKNWIRLISDIHYVPSPLIPSINPLSAQPLDLTHATLRSVSPIHVEYLQNMGVDASMSISLLRDGKLWGLIACHHYSGPHVPPYGTRAAAEFLGSTLSLRLVDQAADDELRDRLASQAVLAKLIAATLDESESIVEALLGAPDLLDLISADGVAIQAQERFETRGRLPEEAQVRAIADWARGTGEEIIATDCLARTVAHLDIAADIASGALALTLPDGQFAIWFREEVTRSIDWGGDPKNKAIAIREGDDIRLSPRKSFERWQEVVRERSIPWADAERDTAAELRRHVIEAMYQRTRGEIRLAETLQRSLLPEILALPGWDLSAHYEPAAGGRIGGDWYDAFRQRDGRLIVVLGDVAGHGIAAAGTMSQLRNALRAFLFDDRSPAAGLARLNEYLTQLLPGAFATAFVARVDLESGRIEAACAGHPKPFVIHRDSAPSRALIDTSPPLGVRGVAYNSNELELPPGGQLVVFSDGLIERRDEDIEAGVARLQSRLSRLADANAHAVWDAVANGGTSDDVTVVSLRRPG